MSGPRDELLRTGTLGPQGIELLYRTVRQVVRSRNFPPPNGTAWTSDQLAEVAHDVFAERGPQRLLELAVRSTDDGSFRRQLWTTVGNHLASANRTTERGRLSERLKDVLEEVPALERSGGLVRLSTAEVSQPEPRFDELVAAAAAVRVTVPTWDPMSARSAPVADRPSLVAIVEAVLALAPSGIPYSDLVTVTAIRLGIHDAPAAVDSDTLDRLAPQAPDDPSATAGNRDAAERMLRGLTIEEQMVLPYIDETSAVISRETGFGRTKAWKISSLLKAKLMERLADDPSPGATLAAAVDIARARWSQ